MGSASGPASPILTEQGRRVGSLGPGLACESADARSGCPANRSAGRGPGFSGTHQRCRPDLPGLGKRPGFHRSGGQRVRAIPQPQKGMALTIVETRAITGGVDTHADVHVAAALDPIGGLLGVREFPATAAGYGRLLSWLGGFGTVCLVGIEGTGSYGAGLARHITTAGVRVVEVDRSDRQDRRRQGKSDSLERRQRCPRRPVRPGPRRVQGPGRRGRGDPRADGRQAQRRRRTHPDHQPGQGPGPDRPR